MVHIIITDYMCLYIRRTMCINGKDLLKWLY